MTWSVSVAHQLSTNSHKIWKGKGEAVSS